MPVATFRVTSTDCTQEEGAFVQAATSLIWDKISTESECWELLVTKLKSVLDAKFGPSWHVLCGTHMSYAVKCRRKSYVTMSGPRRNIVVCWKSPGHEIMSSDCVKIIAQRKLRETIDPIKPLSKHLKVIQQPRLGDVDYSPDFTEALKMIDDLIVNNEDIDLKVVAQTIRNQLTAMTGIVWHVIIGSDFHLASPANITHQLILKNRSLRLHCFKHTEMSSGSEFWRNISDIFLGSWRNLIFIFFCISYMLHSRFCRGESPGGLCPGPEYNLPSLFATIFIILLVGQQVFRVVTKPRR
jgi:hypothetical protein